MRTYTRFTSILAIFVLMLTGAWATAQSGKAADKKAGDPPAPANQNQANSTGRLQNAQPNPMYKDNKLEGKNPLYEGDSSAKSKTSSSSATENHHVVQYRESDDRVTSTSPGNNKAGTVRPVGQPSSPAVVEYKDGEDGTMHTRPGNNKTSAAAPADPHATGGNSGDSKQMHHSRPSSSPN